MASEAPERGASSALLVLIADLVAASGETARGLHRVLPSETVRVRIASIGVGEETVETRIRVCWTRRSPRDACSSASGLATGEGLEVVRVAAASRVHEGVALASGGVIVVASRGGSARADGERKVAERGARDAHWISADSRRGIRHGIRLHATLLDAWTIRVEPAADGGVLEDGDAEGLRTTASLRVDVAYRDAGCH